MSLTIKVPDTASFSHIGSLPKDIALLTYDLLWFLVFKCSHQFVYKSKDYVTRLNAGFRMIFKAQFIHFSRSFMWNVLTLIMLLIIHALEPFSSFVAIHKLRMAKFMNCWSSFFPWTLLHTFNYSSSHSWHRNTG